MRTRQSPNPPQWVVHDPANGDQARGLCAELGLHPLVGELLLRRGLDSPESVRRFLEPSLEHPHDPFLMMGMDAAATRIVQALADGEKILISGDYDVDGITSTSLLAQFLGAAGCSNLETFIPSRFAHGYGLTAKAVDTLLERQPKLVITVDNGITALDEVRRLHEGGVETIITDHHLPRAEGVPAGIVVNPRQAGCAYPFKGISGCGVAFKLVTALRKLLREEGWWNAQRPEPNLKHYLDLVAIGTVADVVPLLDENRVFVRYGLEVLNRGANRPGVAALLAVCRIKREITARTIAYQIAPRINAAGRMSEGGLAVELLLAEAPSRAEELALRLDEENRNRRSKEELMLKEAVELLSGEKDTARQAIVVASPEFHEGIIGIIASRLVERYHCPVVVCAESGESYKGSARTVPGINVSEAITECAHLLQEYGGHAGAAGCKLSRERLQEFREAFAAACSRQAGSGGQAAEVLDGALAPREISPELVAQIASMAPFGHDNEEPTFLLDGVHLEAPPEVLAGRHLKWKLGPGMEMVAWGAAGNIESDPALRFRVKLGFNEYRGNRKIQLTVEDVRRGAP
ncbi:MAG: single-stranded-DNA-specific exonuclease RecJ [SAR324 cluster bacterium]|nr:single-stranded-DNA-specific exonuclease RecJ [SAR324 cluster bacterium]